ncbi:hypothetical protein G6022_00290, partial [Dietzia sp. Cai40]|nr:hypothetical protein [Dietzia sp. Cai40]
IDVFYIPTAISLGVIATILTVSVIASLRVTRGQEAQGLPTPAEPPFRVATAEEDAALEPVWRPRRSAERDREQQTRT